MQHTFWYKIRCWALLLLIFLVTISSHPTVISMSRAAGMESGTVLSRYIVLVFAGLFLMCFNVKLMFKSKIVRTSWLLWALIVLYYLITYSLFGKKTMMSDVRPIAMCLVAIMIGWQLDLDEKWLRIILILFAGLTLFVGLMQVFVNVGGFVIRDQYHADNKNSLGVMLVTSAVLLLFMGLNNAGKMSLKLLFFAGVLLTMVVLLTIRARAATLAGGIMLFYILYERFRGKNFFLFLILGIILLGVVLLILPGTVKAFVYDSFFQSYEGGDITSGRSERNEAALRFLSYHVFLGNLNQSVSVGWIHNYPLNRFFEFGIIFVVPIMLLYLNLLFFTVKMTARSDNSNTYNAGYYVLLIPFIISMAEPTFPYGPGTATVFNFLLFGVSLRNFYNSTLSNRILHSRY